MSILLDDLQAGRGAQSGEASLILRYARLPTVRSVRSEFFARGSLSWTPGRATNTANGIPGAATASSNDLFRRSITRWVRITDLLPPIHRA